MRIKKIKKLTNRKVLISEPKKPSKKPSKKITTVDRYQSDPDFRLRALENQRRYYRKKRGNFELVSPLRSLEYFTEIAELMDVTYNEVITFTAPCITKARAAELLQISPQTLWRQSSGKDSTIPAPVLHTIYGKRPMIVYHQDEIELMLTIIGEHKRRFAYYRSDHIETKQKLFTAINALRQSWENNQWQSASQDDPQPQKRLKPKSLKRKPQ
jgi:hypothetical protein